MTLVGIHSHKKVPRNSELWNKLASSISELKAWIEATTLVSHPCNLPPGSNRH